MIGLVYKSTGSMYTVKTTNGLKIHCRIKGKFRLDNMQSTNPIAVGDIVEFDIDNNSNGIGIINYIRKRKNYILRKSVNLSKQKQILAANIDTLFLVITIINPITTTNFIDRFLIASNSHSIETILIFNKIDLYSNLELSKVENMIDLYTKIGYKCIKLSATKNININELIPLIKNKIIMFGGHSGTGKSSIINCICPKLNLKTGVISDQHLQGKHTTTHAELFDINFGSKIIDTPGIKGFGIVDFKKNEIGDYFPEIFKNKTNCKFNNCLHIDEPNCYIKKLVDRNKIALSRYQNYKQIIINDNFKYRK
tara:strand:+ start:651 stop:1580 length:930 start_codon:yes stop_codon:yes gene_type:complete